MNNLSILTLHHWGENPRGIWQMRVRNVKPSDQASGKFSSSDRAAPLPNYKSVKTIFRHVFIFSAIWLVASAKPILMTMSPLYF